MPAATSANQADSTKFRWVRITTGSISRTVAPAVGQVPDIVMSPKAVSKMPTTGFLLELQAPAVGPATPNAGGFVITVWVRDPATSRWSSFAAATIDFTQLFVTYDIDASELWFQITAIAADGDIDFGIAEQ